jgi:hypothetical protein
MFKTRWGGLFTRVRGRRILGSSPVPHSPKFVKKVTNLFHLSDALTPMKGSYYKRYEGGEEPRVKGRKNSYLPSF